MLAQMSCKSQLRCVPITVALYNDHNLVLSHLQQKQKQDIDIGIPASYAAPGA